MMKGEFGAISRRLNVGGDCADYMWDDIELFYMSYDALDKDDCARIYWNHTGYFEQMVQKLKEVRELAKENRLASWQIVPLSEASVVRHAAQDLADYLRKWKSAKVKGRKSGKPEKRNVSGCGWWRISIR